MTTRVPVHVDGRRLDVEVNESSGGLSVRVNGEPQALDAAQLGPGRWSLLIGTSRASCDVRVRPGRGGGWTVFLDGTSVSATIPGRRYGGRTPADAAADAGPVRISAPMPGRIVRVLAAPGDAVSARQALVVVEAMKMENELRAPRAGRVRDVLVRQGASVEAGAPLLIIE